MKHRATHHRDHGRRVRQLMTLPAVTAGILVAASTTGVASAAPTHHSPPPHGGHGGSTTAAKARAFGPGPGDPDRNFPTVSQKQAEQQRERARQQRLAGVMGHRADRNAPHAEARPDHTEIPEDHHTPEPGESDPYNDPSRTEQPVDPNLEGEY